MIFKRVKSKFKLPEMKNAKIIFAGVFGVLFALYVLFLVFPFFINIDNFAPKISKEVQKATGFELDMNSAKIRTTWNYALRASADSIFIKYKDGSNFVDIQKPSVEINLPTLLFKHLNLDKISAESLHVYLIFTKDKKYTLEDYIKPLLVTDGTSGETSSLPFEIKNINIKVKELKLLLKDELISKTFSLNADNSKLSLASLNGPLKLKTSGNLKKEGSSENYSDFDLDLFVKFPEPKQNGKAPSVNEFKFNFDPFSGLDMFDFRSKLTADLKINEIGEKFRAKGYVNAEDISLNINGNKLPYSFARIKFDGSKVSADSNLYVSSEEFLQTNANLNFDNKPKIKISAKSEKITLKSLKTLTESLLTMFSIKNNLADVSANGMFNCDFALDSDFKTVSSSGNLELKDGNISYPKMKLYLSKINSFLDFSNNVVSIKDTSAYLNGAKFGVSGEIRHDSKLNIKINSEPVKIADIVNLAKELKLVKAKDVADLSFNGGTINLSVLVGGTLKNISPKAKVVLNKASVYVKSLKMPVSLDIADIDILPNQNDFSAKVKASNFKAALKNPVFNISSASCYMNADSKKLNIEPFSVNLNGTNAKISGSVENYLEKPQIALNFSGSMHPNTVMTFIPQQNRKYISKNGQMPFSAKVGGTLEDIKIQAELISDPKNYISIVDIKNTKGQRNTLSADLALKNDTLLINGVNLLSNGVKIASVNGKIDKLYAKVPKLSPLNIVIYQKQAFFVPAFANLSLSADANLALTGSMYAPQINGQANISDLNYPDFKLSASNASLVFNKNILNADASGIKVSGSDFSGRAVVLTDFSKGAVVNSVDFSSNYIDLDKLMELMAKMPNTQVSAGPSVNAVIKTGKAKITKLKSGDMVVENTTFDFDLYKNLFKLKNLVATFANGKITGEATYNMASTKMTADGIAKGLNMYKAAKAFGVTNLIVNGTANGMAKIDFRGTTYAQQMRTLNGQIKFDVSNGQYGEAARFERFIQAGNILTQGILNLNLNQTIAAVTKRNTGEFKKMEGTLSIKNGVATISNFESQGPNMSLYATGTYSILTENANLKVLGKISSGVVKVLGPIGSFSIDKVFDKLPEKGQAVVNALRKVAPSNPFFIQVSANDIAKIPALSTSSPDAASKDFQVLINGPVSRSSSVKSFKWANNTTSN